VAADKQWVSSCHSSPSPPSCQSSQPADHIHAQRSLCVLYSTDLERHFIIILPSKLLDSNINDATSAVSWRFLVSSFFGVLDQRAISPQKPWEHLWAYSKSLGYYTLYLRMDTMQSIQSIITTPIAPGMTAAATLPRRSSSEACVTSPRCPLASACQVPGTRCQPALTYVHGLGQNGRPLSYIVLINTMLQSCISINVSRATLIHDFLDLPIGI
jgi:hypothetical protein